MKCWYCGKELEPHQWCFVVTAAGRLAPVCKDDRTCSPKGIRGHGDKPKLKRQPRNSKLRKETTT